MRYGAIKKCLSNSIHIEKAAGSDEQNKVYCSKAGSFFEEGSPQCQGKRSDLEAVVSAIQNGTHTTRKMVAEEFGTVFIKYHRGITEYLRLARPVPVRTEPTEVRVFWGPPGSGKSRRALEEASALYGQSIYYKPRGLWWDGYEQHMAVIIDDFYGWIKYDELLKIMDRYPYKVQIKGAFEEFTSKIIFITSNVDVDEWYRFVGYTTAAIDRRITIKCYME